MSTRAIALYYGSTPLFWLADVILGINFRAAALEGHPFWAGAYYLFCLGCGLVIWKEPRLTSAVGLTEASVSILMLVVAILLPYFQLIDALAAGGGESALGASPMTAARAVGLFLSGAIWVLAFHLHQGRALARPSLTGAPW